MPDRLEWDESVLRSLLTSTQGPIAKDLARAATKVETAAKQFASGQGGGPQVRTGRLRSSISWQIGLDGLGIFAAVGTNVYYAPFVEFGTDRARPYPFLVPAVKFAR